MVLKLLFMLPQLANVTACVRVVSAMMLSPGSVGCNNNPKIWKVNEAVYKTGQQS